MEDLNIITKAASTTTEKLAEHVAGYAETYVKLGVVNATEKATVVATVSLTAVLLLFFFMFVLLFSGVGIALWVGEALQDAKVGYFCVASFYLLCALIFLALRKKFIFPFVRDQIIRKVYE